jgi:two-component system, sensor histidine kinase and response regulator
LRLTFLILFTASICTAQTDSVAISKLNINAFKIYLNNPDSSLILARKALSFAESKKMPYQVAYSNFVLSKAHWAKSNYQLSSKYGFEALKFFENSPYTFDWAQCLTSLGRTFIDLKNFAQARIYLNKAEGLANRSKQNKLRADVLRERSMLLLQEKKYDSMLLAADEGILLYKSLNDNLNISVLFSRKARALLDQKKIKESKEYVRQSLILDSLVNNKRALGITYFQAAQVAFEENDLDSSLYFLTKLIQKNKELKNPSNLLRSYNLMASIYEKKKRPDISTGYLRLAQAITDTLYNLQINGQVEEMRALYELESKEQTINLLEQEKVIDKQNARNQNILLWFFSVVILLLGLLSYFFYRMRDVQKKSNYELAEKNQNIELQNEEILSQAEALHEINQLKSKILSVVSHDLRSPVNNLQALLEMVTKGQISPDEFSSFIAKLKSNLNVTQRALENLLNWSLSQMEGIQTERTIFNINSIIEDVVSLAEETANQKHIRIETDLKKPVFVEADMNQMHLILRNLLHNAIKFSNANGKIFFCSTTKEKFCEIIVQDQGVGMTKSEINKLLSKNEYFTTVGTSQEKGTGLGLLLCKDFIRRNGGTLSIESTKGSGTRVILDLPLA